MRQDKPRRTVTKVYEDAHKEPFTVSARSDSKLEIFRHRRPEDAEKTRKALRQQGYQQI